MPLGTLWSDDEDRKLKVLVERFGQKKWSLIAQQLQTKGSKQCRRRWKNCLNAELKTGGWTAQEDKLLIESHSKIGNKWTEIAKLIGGRTDNAVKNRWAALCKRRSRPSQRVEIEVKNTTPTTSSPETSSCSNHSHAVVQPVSVVTEEPVDPNHAFVQSASHIEEPTAASLDGEPPFKRRLLERLASCSGNGTPRTPKSPGPGAMSILDNNTPKRLHNLRPSALQQSIRPSNENSGLEEEKPCGELIPRLLAAATPAVPAIAATDAAPSPGPKRWNLQIAIPDDPGADGTPTSATAVGADPSLRDSEVYQVLTPCEVPFASQLSHTVTALLPPDSYITTHSMTHAYSQPHPPSEPNSETLHPPESYEEPLSTSRNRTAIAFANLSSPPPLTISLFPLGERPSFDDKVTVSDLLSPSMTPLPAQGVLFSPGIAALLSEDFSASEHFSQGRIRGGGGNIVIDAVSGKNDPAMKLDNELKGHEVRSNDSSCRSANQAFLGAFLSPHASTAELLALCRKT